MGKTVGKNAEKVVFEPAGSKEGFFVLVEPGMVDKSIPLVDVVQAFTIFDVDNGGSHGVVDKPNAFGTEDETEIVKRILDQGRIVHGASSAASKGGAWTSH
ncbi:hypothetical protein HK105_204648 [Polyrhizophydium stewartii]|uniref:Ribosome maturation protein SDO1/SBDS N-terminal domain-containing protein n=1 Tax=Polyrhizophydium stewartii TaxID=2732419 RepID=A0ABR4N856_9FUNG